MRVEVEEEPLTIDCKTVEIESWGDEGRESGLTVLLYGAHEFQLIRALKRFFNKDQLIQLLEEAIND